MENNKKKKREQYKYAQTPIYTWMFFIWNSHTTYYLFTKNTLAAFQSYEITKSTWRTEEFDRKSNKTVSRSCIVIIHILSMVVYVIIWWDTHATKAFQQHKTPRFHQFLVKISIKENWLFTASIKNRITDRENFYGFQREQ